MHYAVITKHLIWMLIRIAWKKRSGSKSIFADPYPKPKCCGSRTLSIASTATEKYRRLNGKGLNAFRIWSSLTSGEYFVNCLLCRYSCTSMNIPETRLVQNILREVLRKASFVHCSFLTPFLHLSEFLINENIF